MINLKNPLLFNLLFLVSLSAYSAKVDTVETTSPSMNKKIKAVVITPDSYSKNKRFPVVYLLHGYSDNYAGLTINGWYGENTDQRETINVLRFLPKEERLNFREKST